jgi:hypothetical protein
MADDDKNVQGTDVTDDDVVENEENEENEEKEVTTEQEKINKSDYDKLFARMQAADRAKNAAENKLSAIEKAKMGDLERATAERDEAVKQNAELQKAVQQMQIENAFHRENKYTWHDPADALAALDMSVVQIGEDGKVEGLKAAIDDVAKRKPHFVKKDTGPAPVATGDPANGTRKGEKAETADRKSLANRFPALRK